MSNIVAIDTEFLRVYTYRPILSIVQLKEESKEPVIYDVYKHKNEDLVDLLEILSNDDIIKIIHSAHNDAEAIFSRFHISIRNIFDTQIGYRILKNKKNEISYANVVENFCEKKIIKEKSIQKSNWLKRPLTDEQIFYAKQDVLYLHEIYNKMMLSFKENKQKYSQFRHECSLLEDEGRYIFNPQRFWQKIKHHFINNSNYELIKKLVILREKLAYKVNIPREFAIKLKDIVLLAETGNVDILKNVNHKIDKNAFLNILKKYK